MNMKSILRMLVLAWLSIAAFGLFEGFVLRPLLSRQRSEKYRQNLHGEELETALREADFFGKTAHAKFVTCNPDHNLYNLYNQWDFICSIDRYVIPKGAKIDRERRFSGTKFGLMVDATHVTRTSALFPGDGPDPPLK